MSKNEVAKKEDQQVAKSEEKQIARLTDLGDGTVFVKKTESGFVKAVKTDITLSVEKGHIYEILGKYSITKAGYDQMNRVAGVSIITPDTLKLPNGQVVVNPYPIIDPKTNAITKVWVKKVAIGFGPTGNLAMTSRTLLYDIRMYFIQDLMKKIKKSSQCGKICSYGSLTDKEKRDGIFYEIEQGIGIWADPNNVEILKCVETYIQTKLFAERKAQTICERNAMKSHPALTCGSYVGVDANGRTSIPVIGWVNDFSKAELDELRKRAEAVSTTQDNSDLLEDLERNVDEKYESVQSEDLYIAESDEEISEIKEFSDSPEETEETQKTKEHNTENFDNAYADFVAEYGASAIDRIIADNFAGREYEDLDPLEKSVAINRLNRSAGKGKKE